MRRRLLVLSAVLVLLLCRAGRADNGKLWQVKEHLALALRQDEVPKLGCGNLRNVFLGHRDPSKAVDTLFNKHDLARGELRSLARGLSLRARDKKKDTQANGRVALLWWDLRAKKHHRSTAAKDNAFKPDNDRLVAALAVLDSSSIRVGKWLDRENEWKLPLPAKWTTPWAKGGFGFPEDWERTQGIGPSLGGIMPITAGNFTGERIGWDGYRRAAEDRIAVWIRKHPNDRVVVLIVYEYSRDEDRNPRCPAAYRYFAVSETGTLDVQINGGIGTNKSGIELARDKGEVIYTRRKNLP
jgi:hypothetical protein